MQRHAATTILLCLLLAGCASPAPTGDTATAGSGTQAGQATGHAQHATLRYPLAAPVHLVRWANGTVAAQDTCNTGACLVDASRALHATDVSGDLPAGVPVRILAELTYEPPAVVGVGGLELFVATDASTVYSYAEEGEPGHVAVDVLLAPEGKVEVVMLANGPAHEGASAPYTLRIAVDADPALVPAGVPVAVHLGPGTHLMVGSHAGPAAFDLYGPDDAPLGRFTGNHTLPAGAREGAYLVLLPPGDPPATFATDAKQVPLGLVGIRVEAGPVGQVPPHGAYDATWTVPGVPLGVALRAQSAATPVGVSLLASAGFSAALTRANGFQLATPEMCRGCVTGLRYTLASSLGDALVGPGDYHVHAQTDATYGLEVQPIALYAQR
ncbi:MAG: hypothetical protein LC623_07930 [Halobacteriales archaeon]|nr:hypothetical protein [Halobacteriales archaeon]